MTRNNMLSRILHKTIQATETWIALETRLVISKPFSLHEGPLTRWHVEFLKERSCEDVYLKYWGRGDSSVGVTAEDLRGSRSLGSSFRSSGV